MTLDSRCPPIAQDLSAYLDGELDDEVARRVAEHVDACPECRARLERIRAVRRVLRAQPVEDVPDLTRAIAARVAADQMGSQRRNEWAVRARIAAVAAAVAAAVVAGASLPWRASPPDSASAAEVTRAVRNAARELTTYRAAFSITERGWKDAVPVRRFVAEVSFRAPERFRLTVRDRTLYPGPREWPANNLDLVAGPRAWWLREPLTCPAAALPGCVVSQRTVERAVVRRVPFDGTTPLPTDIVLPIETLGPGGGFEVAGRATMLGRTVRVVDTTYRRAAPLVASFQPGGSWRSFGPETPARLWIDARTSVPLRFALGAADRPALDVRATRFSEPASLPPEVFRAPRAPAPASGRFVAVGRIPTRVIPGFTAGLRLYRAGVTESGARVVAYADGMLWVRVVVEPQRRATSLDEGAEQVSLGEASLGYYEPAALTFEQAPRRRVDVFTKGRRVAVEGNLTRRQLIAVAASLPIRGRAIPLRADLHGVSLRRVEVRDLPVFARTPRTMVPGYDLTSAVVARGQRSTTATLYYRRPHADFDPFGIRITQSTGTDVLPPGSEDLDAVSVAGLPGRWSEARGELEWLEGSVYRSVAAPSHSLGTALEIAESLR